MYYEDENNLYHYSYRKGDKVEPIYTKNFAEETGAAEPAAEPVKAKRTGVKLVALALVCALIGGLVGAGAMGAASTAMNRSGGTSTINVSDRKATTSVQSVKVGTQALTMAEVYEQNIDSVVSINTTITRNVFNQVVENAASGSGFIITSDGYIVTNYHVIEGANTVKVTLHSGETYDAQIIGGDEDYDIAVLKIEAQDLQRVTIGDSSTLKIGEDIAAIGNPLGELTFSMSRGIVSCVDRAINVDGTPFNMIQVDCSINPGNSGGPLFNTYGEVVGIVSAKYSSYSSTIVEGIGFAIPINDVIAMVEDIMENGRVTNRPYLAITASGLTQSLAQQYRVSVSEGVYVNSVEPGGAAEKAGIRAGDVIVKIDDKDITSMKDLTNAKKDYKAGDTATFTVNRGGETLTLELTFDATPEEDTAAQQPAQQPQEDYGYNYGDGYGDGYYNPWDFFNNFFREYGNNYYGGNGGYNGSSYADDAA